MGFLAIFTLLKANWTSYAALIIGLIGIFSTWLSRHIEWGWMKLSSILSKIVPTILLAAIFFLILYPVALLSKLFSKDPMKLSGKYNSYFFDVKKDFDKKGLENVW